MKITQVGNTITADFTNIEAQYSNNSVKIPVDLTDSTFDGYSMFASIQIKNFSTYNLLIPLQDGKIIMPSASTYYAGVIMISLYGVKEEIVSTTNNIPFNIIESNPTMMQVSPISQDWVTVMQEYADTLVAQLGVDITPTINSESFNWFIGSIDTGVKAKGDVVTIQPETYHWLINGNDTGVVAIGHTDLIPATRGLLGGVIVGNGLAITTNGLLTNEYVTKTTGFTIPASSVVANTDSNASKYPYKYDYTILGLKESMNADVFFTAGIDDSSVGSVVSNYVRSNTMNDLLRMYFIAKPTVNLPVDRVEYWEVF